MMHRRLQTTATALGVLATALSVSASALAQPSGPPPNQPPPGQPYDQPPQGQYNQPPQGQYNQPPQGAYDQGPPGQYSVPPPQGYQPDDDRYETSPQARQEDERYSYEAERWAAANCVQQRANNTAAGTVIGGILGALVGSGLSGRHDRGAGIIAGGALGAVAGGAIGNSASNNNPNCPPGFGLRAGAAPFYPGPIYGGGVVYAAPAAYDPWIWYGGRWIYRPYPYHRYYYRHYYRR